MENLSFNYCSCPTLTGIDSTYGDCGACGPSGKRISKTVNDITIYTICFDPTMDFDANGSPTNPIAKYVQNPNALDEPISIQTGSGKYYYLFDGLGSVTGLTDTGGSLVATYSYDAFGNIISETGDSTLNAINPYRFTSRVYDKESGLYYYRARYYDSRVGRFTQKDPLRDALNSGDNLYVYVGNNPVNMVDPSGEWGVPCCKSWKWGIWCTKWGHREYYIPEKDQPAAQKCLGDVTGFAFRCYLLYCLYCDLNPYCYLGCALGCGILVDAGMIGCAWTYVKSKCV